MLLLLGEEVASAFPFAGYLGCEELTGERTLKVNVNPPHIIIHSIASCWYVLKRSKNSYAHQPYDFLTSTLLILKHYNLNERIDMDDDNQNLNNAEHDYQEKWQAKRKEMDAKEDQLDAEQRMEYNDAMDNFSEEFDASTDWTEAKWDEWSAKVSKWWNDFEGETDNAV